MNEKIKRQYAEKVDEKTLLKWKLAKKHGSVMHIQKLYGVSRVTLTNAFNGFATLKTIEIINEYFEEEKRKEERRKKRKQNIF